MRVTYGVKTGRGFYTVQECLYGDRMDVRGSTQAGSVRAVEHDRHVYAARASLEYSGTGTSACQGSRR
jgi:hypothetical protein